MKTHVSLCDGHMFEDLSVFLLLNERLNKYPERVFYFVRLSFHLCKGSSSFGRNSSHHCRHLLMVPHECSHFEFKFSSIFLRMTSMESQSGQNSVSERDP